MFDYIEWPSTHHETEKLFGGFNGSIFELRKKYKNCFPSLIDEKDRFDDETNEPIPLQGNIFKKARSKTVGKLTGALHLKDDSIREFKIEY